MQASSLTLLHELLKEFPKLDEQLGTSLQAKWVPFRAKVLTILRAADPSDTNGLVGAFLSIEEYGRYQEPAAGQAPDVYAPLAHPGELAADASTVDQYVYREQIASYTYTRNATMICQLKLHQSLPEFIQSLFISEISMAPRFGTPQAQWAEIESAKGETTEDNLAIEHKVLTVPYRVGTSLADFFCAHEAAHRYRASINLPYQPLDKMLFAKAALSQCGIFDHTLRKFTDASPKLPDQTFAKLKRLMLVDGLVDLAATKSHLSTVSTVTSLIAEVTQLKAQLEAALRTASATAATTAAPSASKKFTPGTHFCWSCGTQTGHPSYACPCPAPGHQAKATKRDTKGSLRI